MKAGCGTANGIEQNGFRGRHPNLSAAVEPGKQGGSTAGVEMGRNFVQKQNRRLTPPRCNQLSMSKHQAED